MTFFIIFIFIFWSETFFFFLLSLWKHSLGYFFRSEKTYIKRKRPKLGPAHFYSSILLSDPDCINPFFFPLFTTERVFKLKPLLSFFFVGCCWKWILGRWDSRSIFESLLWALLPMVRVTLSFLHSLLFFSVTFNIIRVFAVLIIRANSFYALTLVWKTLYLVESCNYFWDTPTNAKLINSKE